MSNISDIYIVDAIRTPVGKAPKGFFKHTLPDELLSHVIRAIRARNTTVDWEAIGDVIVGCAMPEAEQGMNIARIATLLAGLSEATPAMTINRFCSSGLQSIVIAANAIRAGEYTLGLAGGVESMSKVPMGGNKYTANPAIFTSEHIGIAYGMGLTAERVAEKWNITREMQDEFALESHRRALLAQKEGFFKDEIISFGDFCVDEGPRSDTSYEALSKLKPVFKKDGSVTAGNSSQMSDGAGMTLVTNESGLKEYNLKPLGKLLSFAVAGVPPEIMGIGPVKAIPMALKKANLKLEDLDWIELNEAFAAQALAVITELNLPLEKVNPEGSAIALGHPLGATGTLRTATLLHGLRRTGGRYGMVTMCIGTGMGAAAVFESM